MREDHLADDAVSEEPPQSHRERLVVIVLADEHHAPRAIARGDDRAVIVHRQERRLLDDHVLAGRQRLQRQVEVESRRHGDDDGVHLRIRQRRRVFPVRP